MWGPRPGCIASPGRLPRRVRKVRIPAQTDVPSHRVASRTHAWTIPPRARGTVTDVPGFACPPRYVDAGGLGMAHVEDGPPYGEPVLLLHREPSWSFLCRTVMRVLAGRRGARDLPLIVSAEKPTEIGDHGDASGSVRRPLGRARWLVVSGRRHAGAGA